MKGIIFGAGEYGKKAYKGLTEYYGVEILAFCDNDSSKWGERLYCCPVISPEELSAYTYDCIFISTRRVHAFKAVKKQLVDMGIEEKKIDILQLTSEYRNVFMDVRRNWIKDYAFYINENKIQGNVAECGVYRGETAMFINEFFPDRKLYLFDSFEGFSQSDMDYEKKYSEYEGSEFNSNPFKNETKEDIMDVVVKRMPYPKQLELHVGFFPESAAGVDDKFCFVNLDMDLYQPMLSGMQFFWNKMEEGGVILLHDYFHPELPGVQDALAEFEKEIGKKIPKITIGDNCSIALIKM